MVLAVSLLPTGALAQGAQELEPATAPFGDPMTCAAFEKLDSLGRVQALSTIEPLGGEVNPDDPAESEGWSQSVSEACQGHPERPLEEAAREALQTP